MKVLLIPNPNPPYNLMTRNPAWFDLTRKLNPHWVRIKLTDAGWVGIDGSGNAIALRAADDNLTFDGESVFAQTPQEYLQSVIARHKEPTSGDPLNNKSVEGKDYYIVEDSDCPSHDFFDAWEWIGTGVSVNMEKARSIHMDRIRQARDSELTALDVPFIRAVEIGDKVAQDQISTAKQILRDIPQTFDIKTDIKTSDELSKAWPENLPK